MVNELIVAISIKLNKAFGDGYRTYTDVKQGLEEPCFFIKVLRPSQKQFVGNRYYRQHEFDVHYFPEKSDSNTELYTMGASLFDVLEEIVLENGDRIQGIEPAYEVIDGVLHFFVGYNAIVKKVTVAEESMDEMQIQGNLKG